MKNTDLIVWFADDTAGSTKDYWSESNSPPVEDSTSNLVDGQPPVYDSATDKITFVTRRALDTGDSA